MVETTRSKNNSSPRPDAVGSKPVLRLNVHVTDRVVPAFSPLNLSPLDASTEHDFDIFDIGDFSIATPSNMVDGDMKESLSDDTPPLVRSDTPPAKIENEWAIVSSSESSGNESVKRALLPRQGVGVPVMPRLAQARPLALPPSTVAAKAPLPLCIPPMTRRCRWTKDEDAMLLLGVQTCGKDWARISKLYLDGRRSVHQCKARWKTAVCPDIDHAPFRPEEDDTVRAMRLSGYGWIEIAKQLPGRLPDQARERFNQVLDTTRKRTPWTDEEDEILTRAQTEHGNRWTMISKLIPGRSENDIKNRWHNRKTKQKRKWRRLMAEKLAAGGTK